MLRLPAVTRQSLGLGKRRGSPPTRSGCFSPAAKGTAMIMFTESLPGLKSVVSRSGLGGYRRCDGRAADDGFYAAFRPDVLPPGCDGDPEHGTSSSPGGPFSGTLVFPAVWPRRLVAGRVVAVRVEPRHVHIRGGRDALRTGRQANREHLQHGQPTAEVVHAAATWEASLSPAKPPCLYRRPAADSFGAADPDAHALSNQGLLRNPPDSLTARPPRRRQTRCGNGRFQQAPE